MYCAHLGFIDQTLTRNFDFDFDCARRRVEMVLCAAMEEGTESSPIDLEDWRAVGLAESCASNPIVLDDEDSFASSGSDFE